MKKFLLFFILFLPAFLIAQLPDVPAVIDKFQTIYMAVTGVAYFILVAILKNVTLPAWLNTKIISAVVASIVAVVAVFIAGLPAMNVTAVIGLVGTLYNFVKGWIESTNVNTATARK